MKINCDLNSFVYFDIETIPELNPSENILEAYCKLKPLPEGTDKLTWFNQGASLYPEFGRILCISAGVIRNETIRLKSYCGLDEKQIIEDFFEMILGFQSRISGICGHNIKAFDVPFVTKRATVNSIVKLPTAFELFGVKPWESTLMDTAELWKSGQFASPSNLDLLCNLLNIPSPKGAIDGSKVYETYMNGDFESISKYCEADVHATARLLERLTTGSYTI